MRLTPEQLEGLKARWKRAKEGLWAQMYEIKRCPLRGGGYWVINLRKKKTYRVTFPTPLGECSCPDWRGRRLPCKHIFIVAITWGEPLDVWLRKVEEYEPQAQLKPQPEPEPIDRALVWGTE